MDKHFGGMIVFLKQAGNESNEGSAGWLCVCCVSFCLSTAARFWRHSMALMSAVRWGFKEATSKWACALQAGLAHAIYSPSIFLTSMPLCMQCRS